MILSKSKTDLRIDDIRIDILRTVSFPSQIEIEDDDVEGTIDDDIIHTEHPNQVLLHKKMGDPMFVIEKELRIYTRRTRVTISFSEHGKAEEVLKFMNEEVVR